ncbi:MAG: hypothetical protein AB7S99_16950 [Pseudodonghicola sp.]
MLPLLLAASLTAAPVLAEEQDGENRSKMEQGLELFMDGLKQEMAPAMDNLRDMAAQFGPSMRSFLQEMGPALAGMMEEVKDWTRYYPPEMLPNGDIIIRRRPEPEVTPETAPDTGPDSAPGAEGAAPSGATDI